MADLISAVRQAFSMVSRPERFAIRSPGSDDEVERANSVFASRSPESLQATDVGISACWPENFLTTEACHYYMPGFVRLILEGDAESGFSLDDFLSILSPGLILTFSHSQRAAIASALEVIRKRVDQRGRELIDRRLKRLIT